ncbi:hypothetical protein ABXN37_09495 [Piscinibacter sakaiensis]|uniref:hypothetical protein n=1 Tax=Piscinibacter sakaiensis TaxID=1547922 RepID=UPI003727A452
MRMPGAAVSQADTERAGPEAAIAGARRHRVAGVQLQREALAERDVQAKPGLDDGAVHVGAGQQLGVRLQPVAPHVARLPAQARHQLAVARVAEVGVGGHGRLHRQVEVRAQQLVDLHRQQPQAGPVQALVAHVEGALVEQREADALQLHRPAAVSAAGRLAGLDAVVQRGAERGIARAAARCHQRTGRQRQPEPPRQRELGRELGIDQQARAGVDRVRRIAARADAELGVQLPALGQAPALPEAADQLVVERQPVVADAERHVPVGVAREVVRELQVGHPDRVLARTGGPALEQVVQAERQRVLAAGLGPGRPLARAQRLPGVLVGPGAVVEGPLHEQVELAVVDRRALEAQPRDVQPDGDVVEVPAQAGIDLGEAPGAGELAALRDAAPAPAATGSHARHAEQPPGQAPLQVGRRVEGHEAAVVAAQQRREGADAEVDPLAHPVQQVEAQQVDRGLASDRDLLVVQHQQALAAHEAAARRGEGGRGGRSSAGPGPGPGWAAAWTQAPAVTRAARRRRARRVMGAVRSEGETARSRWRCGPIIHQPSRRAPVPSPR